MWKTPEGIRKLEGAERRVFVVALLQAIRYVDEPDFEFDHPILDQIRRGDRFYAFMSVGAHLLGDGPNPRLHAWNEAIISDIFEWLESEIEMEIQGQKTEPKHPLTFCRELVLAAAKEAGVEKDGFTLPKPRSKAGYLWDGIVGALGERVMGDADPDLYETLADAPPEFSKRMMKDLGLPEDYFSATPPIFPAATKNRLTRLYRSLMNEHDSWFEPYNAVVDASVAESIKWFEKNLPLK